MQTLAETFSSPYEKVWRSSCYRVWLKYFKWELILPLGDRKDGRGLWVHKEAWVCALASFVSCGSLLGHRLTSQSQVQSILFWLAFVFSWSQALTQYLNLEVVMREMNVWWLLFVVMPRALAASFWSWNYRGNMI